MTHLEPRRAPDLGQLDLAPIKIALGLHMSEQSASKPGLGQYQHTPQPLIAQGPAGKHVKYLQFPNASCSLHALQPTPTHRSGNGCQDNNHSILTVKYKHIEKPECPHACSSHAVVPSHAQGHTQPCQLHLLRLRAWKMPTLFAQPILACANLTANSAPDACNLSTQPILTHPPHCTDETPPAPTVE